MRKDGDKISIRTDADGHYVFYSFRDEHDHGTILDFVMRRQGRTSARRVRFYGCGQERRGLPSIGISKQAPRGNRDAVAAEYKPMKELRWHEYLEQERKLPRSVLLSARFRSRIRVDARANAIFPHEDEAGLCGFEKRNRNFKALGILGKRVSGHRTDSWKIGAW